MPLHTFRQLTERQQVAFEQVVTGRMPRRRMLNALVDRGMIEGVMVLEQRWCGLVPVCRYSVPRAVLRQWHVWQSFAFARTP